MVLSSTRPLGGRRGVAPVDDIAAARAAELRRIDDAATHCAGTVHFSNAVSARKHRDANGAANDVRPSDAKPERPSEGHADADSCAEAYPHTDTCDNPHAESDSDPQSNSGSHPYPNPNSRAANVQPRLHHRDGERGVGQRHWE